jgi:prefoldin beta subunit
MSNPGTELSKAVEAEAIRFREIQDEIQKLRADQQTLLSQQSENEMVKQELNFLSDGDQVYKMIGPTLMKNDTEDAKQTVEQRLTMITGEL